MTIIAAVAAHGRAAIAADRQGSETSTQERFHVPTPKIQRFDSWAYGVSGHSSAYDAVRYGLPRLLSASRQGAFEGGLSADQWVQQDLLAAYRQVMEEQPNISRLSLALVVYDADGWHTFQITRTNGLAHAEETDGVATCGSGRLAARGAHYATIRESPMASAEHVARRMVEAANATVYTCSGAPLVVSLESPV